MQLCRINRTKWLKIGHYWYFHHAVYQVLRFSIFLSEASLSALKKSTTKSVFLTSPAGVRLSVCLCVCPQGYLRNHTRDLYQIFVHVAYVCGSVCLRHVDDRPHRLSAGRGWRECTARTKCNLRLPCFFLWKEELSSKHVYFLLTSAKQDFFLNRRTKVILNDHAGRTCCRGGKAGTRHE